MDALRENQAFVDFESKDYFDPDLLKPHEISVIEAPEIAKEPMEGKTQEGSRIRKTCNQIWHALFGTVIVRHIGPEEHAELIRKCEYELYMRSYHWRI